MKQKILTFTTVALLASFISYAQSAPKPSLFLKGGLNLSNITINKNGDLDNNKMLPSFQVGLLADLPIGSFFAIQPGVFFTGKGAKLESGNTSGSNWYRATTRPYYIEVPVNAVIKLPLGDQSSFFFGAGPYVAVGIAGNNKLEGQVGGVSFSNSKSIKFSNDDPFTSSEEGSGYNIMRRFDYGLNGTVGIQSKFAVFSVNYGLGLAKLQSGTSSSDDELNKYRVLSFTVGFKL
ncbi:MAG: porin family protein [Bacteroidota bacterium]